MVQVLYFYNKTLKYDNVRVAPRTLVKVVLNVSSTGCNNKQQSFPKLSFSAIDNVLVNCSQQVCKTFQVLKVSKVTTVNKLLECSPDRIIHWI